MSEADFFSNFYVLRDPISKKHFRGKTINDIGDFGKALRDEKNISQLDVEYAEGTNEPSSFFWNRLLEPFCINEDLFNKLKENNSIRPHQKLFKLM